MSQGMIVFINIFLFNIVYTYKYKPYYGMSVFIFYNQNSASGISPHSSVF